MFVLHLLEGDRQDPSTILNPDIVISSFQVKKVRLREVR